MGEISVYRSLNLRYPKALGPLSITGFSSTKASGTELIFRFSFVSLEDEDYTGRSLGQARSAFPTDNIPTPTGGTAYIHHQIGQLLHRIIPVVLHLALFYLIDSFTHCAGSASFHGKFIP